jgi:predicted CXXCH cytochrome family protein
VARGHTVGGPKLLDPRKPDRPFSCASCHNPHGSDFPFLAYSGANAMESCDGCHGDKSGKNPAMKSVISRAKKPGTEPNSGAAGAGAGGAGSGAGAGPGAGSGGGSPGPGPGSGDGAPPAR